MTLTNDFSNDGLLELVPFTVITNLGTVLVGNKPEDKNITLFVAYFVVNPDFPFINITYRARLTNLAASGANATLTSNLVYLSSPTPYARYTNISANSTIGTLSPSISAAVHSSSLDTTSGNQIAIGEIAHIYATVTLTEGIITNPTLNFTVPASLALVNASVVSLGNASACATVPMVSLDHITGTAAFAFDDLCNYGDNILDDNDRVVVDIVVQARDVAANQRGASLTCVAKFSYGQGFMVSGQTTVTIVEPVLRVTILASQPTLGGDFGTNVKYTMTLSHTQLSNSYAYNVEISNLVPAELDLDASSLKLSSGNYTLSGRSISLQFAQLAFGQTYTLSYNASLGHSQLATDSIQNTATVKWNSLPSYPGSRNSSASSSVFVTIGVASLAKFNLTTSLPETVQDETTDPATELVAIGEIVTTYAQTLVPNGERPYIYLALELPLESQQFRVLQVNHLVGGSITVQATDFGTTNNSVWFNFTDILNPLDGFVDEGDMIWMSVTAVVTDVHENQNQVVLSNNATLKSADAHFSASLPLRVVVPDLSITNSVTIPNPNYTQAGDVLSYRVVVAHTDNSSTAAYVVNVTDSLSPYHTLVVGSVVSSNGSVIKGNKNGDSAVLVSLPVFQLGDGIL